MAKHRKLKQSWAPKAVLVGTTAMSLSTAMVVCHSRAGTVEDPRVELAAATQVVYGVGGSGDEDGANIQRKLNNKWAGADSAYVPIVYPASIPIDPSVEEGLPALHNEIMTNGGDVPKVVVGYSEGAIVAEYERRKLQELDPADPSTPGTDDLSFWIIAGPTVPNGGIYARFPDGIAPGFTSTGPAQPSRYDTTYVTVEYDTVADFPAYFNPLSITNSVIAFYYSHGDPSYDAADLDNVPPDTPNMVKEVTNSAGGTDTYIFIPVEHLQMLQPARDLSATVGTTAVTEPVFGAAEPTLRVFVDMGYTDRENQNPETPTPFSLITPPEKVIEAALALPGAAQEGRDNFRDGVAAVTPVPDTERKSTKRSTEPAGRSVSRVPRIVSDGNRITPGNTSASDTLGSAQTTPRRLGNGPRSKVIRGSLAGSASGAPDRTAQDAPSPNDPSAAE